MNRTGSVSFAGQESDTANLVLYNERHDFKPILRAELKQSRQARKASRCYKT